MRAAVLVAIGLSMIGSARAADMVDVTRKPIQIPPEELRLALPTFGELEGLHVVFLSEDVQNRKTDGVSGSLTYAEALEQLLRGTDLTYRLLEAHTVMILPATGMDLGASMDAGTPVRQVTITASRPSDSQQLEYFRLLAAMSRSEYRRVAKTLPFLDAVTVRFPGGKGPESRLPLGQHIQSAGVNGLVVWRVIKLTPKKAESELQVHNNNSFPVFVEVDLQNALGHGPYAAIAPGETAIWSWPPTPCGNGGPWLALSDGLSGGTHALAEPDCRDYEIRYGIAHLRMLKEWEPAQR